MALRFSACGKAGFDLLLGSIGNCKLLVEIDMSNYAERRLLSTRKKTSPVDVTRRTLGGTALLLALAAEFAPLDTAASQGFYRPPTLGEAIKMEFDSLFVGITLNDSTARLARLAISEYEGARRSLRPPPTRMQFVADSLRTRRDSALLVLLTTPSDSARFRTNALLRRRPRG